MDWAYLKSLTILGQEFALENAGENTRLRGGGVIVQEAYHPRLFPEKPYVLELWEYSEAGVKKGTFEMHPTSIGVPGLVHFAEVQLTRIGGGERS